jgi:hypothetical protein
MVLEFVKIFYYNFKKRVKTRKVGCSLKGVLARAKNGDELFWEEKFHAANGKAQECHQGALLFPRKFGGGRGGLGWAGRFLKKKFRGSQCVPCSF